MRTGGALGRAWRGVSATVAGWRYGHPVVFWSVVGAVLGAVVAAAVVVWALRTPVQVDPLAPAPGVSDASDPVPPAQALPVPRGKDQASFCVDVAQDLYELAVEHPVRSRLGDDLARQAETFAATIGQWCGPGDAVELKSALQPWLTGTGKPLTLD
jgi:hypothetical protein